MRVVTFDDIVRFALETAGGSKSRRYVYRKYVKRLVEGEKLQPIRKGLYAVLNPFEKPDRRETEKLLIASKVRKDYYLGFHTALEYYGCAYSAFNEAYVCVRAKDRFDRFSCGRFAFEPVFVTDLQSHIVEKPYGQSFLRVSSKERTFVECVDRVQYAGGWEECIKSLAELGGIDFEELVGLTLARRKQVLVRKVGYFLELLRGRSPFYEHVGRDLLEQLASRVKGSPQYLVREESGEISEKWRLYVPAGLEQKLRGI